MIAYIGVIARKIWRGRVEIKVSPPLTATSEAMLTKAAPAAADNGDEMSLWRSKERLDALTVSRFGQKCLNVKRLNAERV